MMLGQPVVDSMIQHLPKEGFSTNVGIIQVGSRPECNSYIMQVDKTVPKVPGMKLDLRRLQEDCSPEGLQREMADLNRDPAIGGYMLQLPLPPHLMEQLQIIRQWIDADKDIDLLGYEASGTLLYGKRKEQIVPPTPYAVLKTLQYYGCSTSGRVMAIVGDGEVGSRLKIMVGNDKCNHIVLNETVEDLNRWTRQADIVVGCAGVPDLITGDSIREGAVVVNVGVKFKDGKLHGDVDVDSVSQKASKVTPRIGGLGPVTVMSLLQNVQRAARRQKAT